MENSRVGIAPGTSTSERLKIAIAIMAYGGQIHVGHARMWFEFGAMSILNAAQVAVVGFRTIDVNPVDRARNFALSTAIQAGADWLLMVDADTFVVPSSNEPAGGQLIRMIMEANAYGATIAVAPVRARGDKHIMVYGVQVEHTYQSAKLDSMGLIPIEAGASAIMAIDLRKIGECAFTFEAGTPLKPGLSEDLSFCKQVRAISGKIVCDTRVTTGHVLRPNVALSHPFRLQNSIWTYRTTYGESVPADQG